MPKSTFRPNLISLEYSERRIGLTIGLTKGKLEVQAQEVHQLPNKENNNLTPHFSFLTIPLQQVDAITPLVPEESVPFVGEALRRLRADVGNQAAVLGFVGAPFTLATYIVEGGMSKNYTHIKQLMFTEPEVLHGLLQKLADAVVTYIKYQADAGAQTVQIFDSWAAQLSPQDFDVFAGPYISYIIQQAKKVCEEKPIKREGCILLFR